jgi:hypothetical protein
MTPDALNDDCLLSALLKPGNGDVQAFVEVDTIPIEPALLDRTPVVGEVLRFKPQRDGAGWLEGRVWKIDGELVCLELW